jgi:hypothetical protein
MAKKKAEEQPKSQPDNVKVIIQPDGRKVSLDFLDKLDVLVLSMYENTLPEQDKTKIDQDPVFLSKLESYVRDGIIQLDMPVNGIQLNENQKKIREYWFKDPSEDATREQVLGTERYQWWKQSGSMEPPPEMQSSPASENKSEAYTTLNVETNIHVEEEKKEEENTMFNNTQNNQNGQNGQQAQAPQNGQQQQQQGNILTDALGAVDEFTDHWYGKAAIAGGAAFATYKILSSKSEDPDYSSAGDDAVSDYGGNFF